MDSASVTYLLVSQFHFTRIKYEIVGKQSVLEKNSVCLIIEEDLDLES